MSNTYLTLSAGQSSLRPNLHTEAVDPTCHIEVVSIRPNRHERPGSIHQKVKLKKKKNRVKLKGKTYLKGLRTRRHLVPATWDWNKKLAK